MGRTLESFNTLVDGQASGLLDQLAALGVGDAGDLRRLGEAMIELADALANLGPSPPAEPIDDVELAALARRIQNLRLRRKAFLPDDLFADPAWDLLLEIFIGTVKGIRILTKTVCGATDVPASTALRWIGILEARGLIKRWTPPDDQRITTVQMTAAGFRQMRRCLSEWLANNPDDRRRWRREVG